jgi:Tfp pilus assembly protein PilN
MKHKEDQLTKSLEELNAYANISNEGRNQILKSRQDSLRAKLASATSVQEAMEKEKQRQDHYNQVKREKEYKRKDEELKQINNDIHKKALLYPIAPTTDSIDDIALRLQNLSDDCPPPKQ